MEPNESLTTASSPPPSGGRSSWLSSAVRSVVLGAVIYGLGHDGRIGEANLVHLLEVLAGGVALPSVVAAIARAREKK